MERRTAIAGSLESSDVLVSFVDGEGDLAIQVESVVAAQRGRLIRSVAQELVHRAGVESGILTIQDRGALECTLRARLETVLERLHR